MSKPSIIITGANGFIGEALVNFFHKKSWKVKAFVHSMPSNKISDVEYIQYNMENEVKENDFKDVKFLIHCAYLKYENNSNSDAININGTKRLLEICRKQNITPIYISSFSAHNKAESHYGKTKLACEKLFDFSKDIIIKPGFVIGNKGLAGELIKQIKKATFFPLIGGGNQPIQTVSINDLCLAIESTITNNFNGIFHIAETKAISTKIFYKEIALQLNKKINFIPVPLLLLYYFCDFCENFEIQLPVTTENILGLKQLIIFDTKKDLDKLGISLKDYKQNIHSTLH